jgi:hypothetical protein
VVFTNVLQCFGSPGDSPYLPGLGANEWTRQCPSSPKSDVGNPWRSPQRWTTFYWLLMAADGCRLNDDWLIWRISSTGFYRISSIEISDIIPVEFYRWYSNIFLNTAVAWLQPDSDTYNYRSLASLAQLCSSCLIMPFSADQWQPHDPRLCEAVLRFQHLQDVVPCHLDTVNQVSQAGVKECKHSGY